MAYETIVYERKKLYAEVWAEPVRNVAKRYRVSDVALAKTCRKVDIPLPPQGYWLRPEARRGKRPALPPAKPGANERWEVQHYVKEKREVPPEVAAKVEEESAPEALIVVPDDLARPHKLVALSARLLRKQKPYEGLVCCRSEPCLNLRVSLEALDRALRIMDALLRALDARGLKVDLKQVERPGYATAAQATVVVVDGEPLSFSLWEKYSLKTIEPEKPPKNLAGHAREIWTSLRAQNERVPNGRFALAVHDGGMYGTRKTWADSPTRKIESSLNAFVAELYVAAADIKQRRINEERARVERAKEQERAYKSEQRRQAEEQRLKDFKALLERWHFARDARDLVREVRLTLTVRGLRVSKGGHVEEWLDWIAEQARKADPLSDLRRDADEMASKHRTWRLQFGPLGSRLRRARQRARLR